jgi:hypothetical protein
MPIEDAALTAKLFQLDKRAMMLDDRLAVLAVVGGLRLLRQEIAAYIEKARTGDYHDVYGQWVIQSRINDFELRCRVHLENMIAVWEGPKRDG